MSDKRILVFDNLSAFAAELKSKYARKATVEELANKVNALEVTGGQANVIEEIQVNGVKQTVTDKKVNLTMPTKVSELENDAKYQSDTDVAALIDAAVAALSIGDYAKAADLIAAVERIAAIEADYLKAADKTELQGAITAEAERAAGVEGGLDTRIAAIEGDYLKAADKTELQGNIDTLTGVVNTLSEGVDAEKVDGVKDLIAYVEEHGSEVTGMKEDIEENASAIAGVAERMTTAEGKITAVEGAVATKAEQTYVDDAIAALSIGDYAKASELTALAARVKAIEDDYLKAADKTELQGAINGVDAKFANYTNTTDMNAAIKAVDDKFASYSTTEQMNSAIGAVDAKFANYSTTEQMNSAIGAVDAKFANYTTTTELAANYVKVADVGTVTAAEVTALLAD